jgi:hypothetical protein
MKYSIEDVMDKGFNNNLNEVYNSNKHFSFRNGIFYSYEEPIAKKDGNDLIILPKSGKYGNFISKTTSNHISKLEQFCKKYDIHYTIYNLIL